MVDVCYAEVEWGGEDEGGGCGSGGDEHVEGEKEGAEEKFLVSRAGDEVAPADPAA